MEGKECLIPAAVVNLTKHMKVSIVSQVEQGELLDESGNGELLVSVVTNVL